MQLDEIGEWASMAGDLGPGDEWVSMQVLPVSQKPVSQQLHVLLMPAPWFCSVCTANNPANADRCVTASCNLPRKVVGLDMTHEEAPRERALSLFSMVAAYLLQPTSSVGLIWFRRAFALAILFDSLHMIWRDELGDFFEIHFGYV